MKQKKYGKKIARGVILIVYTMMSYASQPQKKISPVAQFSLFEPGSDVAPFVQQRFADSNTGAAAKKLYEERQDRMYSPGQQTIVQAPTPRLASPYVPSGKISAGNGASMQSRDGSINSAMYASYSSPSSIFNPLGGLVCQKAFEHEVEFKKTTKNLVKSYLTKINNNILTYDQAIQEIFNRRALLDQHEDNDCKAIKIYEAVIQELQTSFKHNHAVQGRLLQQKLQQQHNKKLKPVFKELKEKTTEQAESRAFLTSLSQYLSDENPSSPLAAVEQQSKSSEQAKSPDKVEDVKSAWYDFYDENPSSPSAAVKQQTKSSQAKYPDVISALDDLYFG